MFNQYNELNKLLFKNQKGPKLNVQYAMGLARALGLNLRKDAFSEKNMLQKDHILFLKEKLVMNFWEVIARENKSIPLEEDLTEASTEDSMNISQSIIALSKPDISQ